MNLYSRVRATRPLDRMSLAEKLQIMEALWEDLSRTGDSPSPKWHADVLRVREDRFQSGKEKPIDWETAKEEIRRRIK